MTARILALLALAVLIAYLLVLALKLGRTDLWALVAATLALAVWDVIGGWRRRGGG